jgi:hypothetical protein
MATEIAKETNECKVEIIIEGVKSTVKSTNGATKAVVNRTLYTKDLFEVMSTLVDAAKEKSGTMFQSFGSDYSSVRYWEETTSGQLILVCEASPSIRTFHGVGMRGYAEDEGLSNRSFGIPGAVKDDRLTCTIHWPYTVMLTVMVKVSGEWRARDGYIAWADESIKDMSSPLYGMTLPNTYGPRGGGDNEKCPYRICWGQVSAFKQITPITSASLIPTFYASDFNYDLLPSSWYQSVLRHMAMEVIKDKKDLGLNNGRLTLQYMKNIQASATRGSLYLTNSTFGDALSTIRGNRGGY